MVQARPLVCEIHRVAHHNPAEGDPDHSWLPLVNGRILRNRNHKDGFFFGMDAARQAIFGVAGKNARIRIVK